MNNVIYKGRRETTAIPDAQSMQILFYMFFHFHAKCDRGLFMPDQGKMIPVDDAWIEAREVRANIH